MGACNSTNNDKHGKKHLNDMKQDGLKFITKTKTDKEPLKNVVTVSETFTPILKISPPEFYMTEEKREQVELFFSLYNIGLSEGAVYSIKLGLITKYSEKETLLGVTNEKAFDGVKNNQLNFDKTFIFDYFFETIQTLYIYLIENGKVICTCQASVGEIMGSDNSNKTFTFSTGKGKDIKLKVQGEPVSYHDYDLSIEIAINFGGIKGMPYFVIKRCCSKDAKISNDFDNLDKIDWIKAYKSEVLINYPKKNKFKAVTLSTQFLCNSDMENRPILIEFFDATNTSDEIVGSMYTTVNKLVDTTVEFLGSIGNVSGQGFFQGASGNGNVQDNATVKSNQVTQGHAPKKISYNIDKGLNFNADKRSNESSHNLSQCVNQGLSTPCKGTKDKDSKESKEIAGIAKDESLVFSRTNTKSERKNKNHLNDSPSFQRRGSDRFNVTPNKNKHNEEEISENLKNNLDNPNYKEILLNCHYSKRYKFLEYIRGGTIVSMIVGIDFTSSNGDPSNSDSLHAINKKPNFYEQAIECCCKVVAPYDDDQLFPVYGFGAQLDSNEDCNAFSLNMKKDANVCTVQGILDVYRRFLPEAKLAGPTFFSPLISKCNLLAKNSKKLNNSETYYILLILTDGLICDMDDTIDNIVEASNYPLSIIIIGIGPGDTRNGFQGMEVLDSDDKDLVSSRGEKAVRDIVQFVEFNKFQKDLNGLAEQVLEEIPRQVEGYFKMIGKAPM